MFDLLVIGEINPDLILRGDVVPAFGQAEKLVDSAALAIGSSSVIMACGAARLGLSVAFMGLVGDDEFGRFMLAAMGERGLDTSACVVGPDVATGLSVILAQPGGDRAILTYPGAIPLLTAEQVDLGLLQRARHVHVGSYFLQDGLRPGLPRLFARAREMGLTTSLDPNWDPRGVWDVGEILPQCDVFLPNQAELARISGSDDLMAGLDWLAERVATAGTLAVKLGKQGGVARQGSRAATAASLPVAVVDTTGAGDSFDAGFIYGYLSGYALEDALALASACGSLSTRGAGGTAAQPTLAEAQAALRVQNGA